MEPPIPASMHLDLGNVCNLRCPACAGKVGGVGTMSPDTFDVVFERIAPYAQTLLLYNWGEPTAVKGFLDKVRRISARGIKTSIDTNFSVKMWTAAEAEEFVASRLTRVIVSADGATQASYERYRVNGRLGRVFNNMRQVVAAKKRLNSTAPYIAWKFLLNRFNQHEVPRAYEIARDIGVPLEFGMMECPHDPSWYSTRYGYDKGLPAPYNPGDAEPGGSAAPITRSSVPDVPGCNESAGRVIRNGDPVTPDAPLVRNPNGTSNCRLHPGLRAVCVHPFDSVIINWDGRVFPCCEAVEPPGYDISVGDLREQTLEEVWYGPKMEACRTWLLNYGPVQNGGSVCERAPCSVKKKWLTEHIQYATT